MKKQTNLLFYILSIYVIVQFLWWGFHLIQLSRESADNESIIFRKTLMIVGEGSVFLLLLIFGLFKISSSIRKELTLSQRQSNFLLSVTHELKTPISTIGLSSEMLIRNDFTQDPDRLKRYAEIIHKENKRLENQVEIVVLRLKPF